MDSSKSNGPQSTTASLPAPQGFSLPALLALATGISILAGLQLNRRRISDWPESVRSAIAAVGIVLIVLSVVGTVLHFIRRRRGTSHRRSSGFVKLPREGAAYLVIMMVMAAGSLIGRSNLLMLVFAMMCGPFVMNGWIVSAMLSRLRVSRHVPRRAVAGQPVSIEVGVNNRKRWISSRLILVEDEITNGRDTLRPSIMFVRIPPVSKRHGAYTLRLMQRGRYRLRSLAVSSRFPLGLGVRGRFFPAADEILVHPHVGRLREGLKRMVTDSTEVAERARGHSGMFDDEFHRIREFRDGDNPRAIHWRTTARQNELMVREFEQSRDQNLVILLDLCAPDAPAHLVELAISFVSTIFVEHSRDARDAQIGLFLSGRTFHGVSGSVSSAILEQMLDMLAVAETTSEDRTDQLLDESRTARLQASGVRVLFLTARPDDVTCRLEERALESHGGAVADTAGRIRVVPMDEPTIMRYFMLPLSVDDQGPALDSNGAES